MSFLFQACCADDQILTWCLKALYGYRHAREGSVVIQAGYLGVLGHRDYVGLLETCRYYRLGQGQVENVSEDTCQLVCECSEYTSWLLVWPCSLVNVDRFMVHWDAIGIINICNKRSLFHSCNYRLQLHGVIGVTMNNGYWKCTT